MARVPYNKLLTNLAGSSRTGDYWSAVVFFTDLAAPGPHCLDLEPIGTLSKPRRQRQRERHQTKSLMSRTIAVLVRHKSLYASLPSSAKQQREMTKFCVFSRT